MADVWLDTERLRNLLEVSPQAIRKAIAARKFTTRQVAGGRGGRGGMKHEALLSSLPPAAQERYQKQQADALLAAMEAEKQPPRNALVALPKDEKPVSETPIEKPIKKGNELALIPPVDLSDKQKDRGRARKRILDFVEGFHGTMQAALAHLNEGYQNGELTAGMRWAMDTANDRLNEGRAGHLSLSTVKKWKAQKASKGTLVPTKSRQPVMTVELWHRAAVELRKRPQGSTLRWVEEELAKAFKPAPTYDQIRRFFDVKFSAGEQLKGRHTGMELRAKQFYQHRTAAGLEPWQEVHADGWCTHFTAPHPVTGDYVTYEIWDYHDVATRIVPPFGIGLTECFEVIAKGLENAIRVGGIMAILQTDSTKIVKDNDRFTRNPATAIAQRAGITIVHPKTVGNAQANGIAENFHAWMDKESRELATYQAEGMDRLTFKRVQKFTSAMVKAQAKGEMEAYHKAKADAERAGKGIVFGSYQEALDWLEEKRRKWNEHPHRGLKKIRDGITGRMRHQSPDEALAEWRANGWEPVALEEHEIIDLFRPHVQVKVTRGTVKPYGKMRFRHADLTHWEGKDVVVSYDIMDWQEVQVKDMAGGLICMARFVEATGFRAQTAYEEATERRAMAQIKRLDKKAEKIRDRAGLVIDGQAVDVTPLRVQDFLPAEIEEPELRTIPRAEFIPHQEAEDDEPASYQDTLLWLFGGKEGDEDDDREAAEQ